MFDMERELLEAIGINAGKMDLMDVYLTAGKIINDHELTMLSIKDGKPGDLLGIIRAMSPADRLSLRERVVRVIKLPNH